MPTTPNGLPFPVIGGDNNPPEDIQALAEAVDTKYGIGSTAPVDITLSAGYVLRDRKPQVMRVGPMLYFDGGITNTGGSFAAGTFTGIATIPVGTAPLTLRPAVQRGAVGFGPLATFVKVVINANGTIDIVVPSGGSTYVRLDGISIWAI